MAGARNLAVVWMSALIHSIGAQAGFGLAGDVATLSGATSAPMSSRVNSRLRRMATAANSTTNASFPLPPSSPRPPLQPPSPPHPPTSPSASGVVAAGESIAAGALFFAVPIGICALIVVYNVHRKRREQRRRAAARESHLHHASGRWSAAWSDRWSAIGNRASSPMNLLRRSRLSADRRDANLWLPQQSDHGACDHGTTSAGECRSHVANGAPSRVGDGRGSPSAPVPQKVPSQAPLADAPPSVDGNAGSAHGDSAAMGQGVVDSGVAAAANAAADDADEIQEPVVEKRTTEIAPRSSISREMPETRRRGSCMPDGGDTARAGGAETCRRGGETVRGVLGGETARALSRRRKQSVGALGGEGGGLETTRKRLEARRASALAIEAGAVTERGRCRGIADPTALRGARQLLTDRSHGRKLSVAERRLCWQAAKELALQQAGGACATDESSTTGAPALPAVQSEGSGVAAAAAPPAAAPPAAAAASAAATPLVPGESAGAVRSAVVTAAIADERTTGSFEERESTVFLSVIRSPPRLATTGDGATAAAQSQTPPVRPPERQSERPSLSERATAIFLPLVSSTVGSRSSRGSGRERTNV